MIEWDEQWLKEYVNLHAYYRSTVCKNDYLRHLGYANCDVMGKRKELSCPTKIIRKYAELERHAVSVYRIKKVLK